MLIGAMNHPGNDVRGEIAWIKDLGLDFIDLTLEPPAAAPWNINPKEIRRTLEQEGLRVVGHTAYYLPLASPFERVRRSAVEELKRCLEAFGLIGAKWMNLHLDGHVPFHDQSAVIEKNVRTIQELLPVARDCGVGIMVENTPGRFNSAQQLAGILDPLPEVGLHLDIGHCNLMVESNTTEAILNRFASRLRHVHLHDNKGGSMDLHLPLGAGTLDSRQYVCSLKRTGYDGTITLEVFSADRHYLAYSRDVLRRLWEEAR
jgi:sugar phosphate isomerase/epimerase